MKWQPAVRVQKGGPPAERGQGCELKEVVLFDPSEHPGSSTDEQVFRVVMDSFIGQKLRPHQIEG